MGSIKVLRVLTFNEITSMTVYLETIICRKCKRPASMVRHVREYDVDVVPVVGKAMTSPCNVSMFRPGVPATAARRETTRRGKCRGRHVRCIAGRKDVSSETATRTKRRTILAAILVLAIRMWSSAVNRSIRERRVHTTSSCRRKQHISAMTSKRIVLNIG